MVAVPVDVTGGEVPPVPVPSDLTRFFWEGVAEGRLRFLRCPACGHYIPYPRTVCNRCLSEDLAPEDVSGKGRLYSYTVVTQAFHPWFVDRLPYTLAVIELDEEPGLRMTSNMVDCPEEKLHIDLPVEVVFTEVAP